ncbi:hypothetical protein GCM10012276_19630 [Nocardioides deserti]|nr:hypothetical protein GCM10012276_19630 [Nocardioides deserti]
MPPAWLMPVATAPTTPWSGAVCSRMVMEYDDVVAADRLVTGPLSAPAPVTGKSPRPGRV